MMVVKQPAHNCRCKSVYGLAGEVWPEQRLKGLKNEKSFILKISNNPHLLLSNGGGQNPPLLGKKFILAGVFKKKIHQTSPLEKFLDTPLNAAFPVPINFGNEII